MSRCRTSTRKSVPIQSMELAMSIPQVMALRLTRLWAPGAAYSPHDYLELNRMWTEKLMAFGESWSVMSSELFRYQQHTMASYARYWFNPWLAPYVVPNPTLMDSASAGEKVLRKGLAPIHRRVVANVKRLGGSRTS